MDWTIIISIFILLLPFIVLFLPFILAWLRGAKNLHSAHQKYMKALEVTFRRLFNATLSYEIRHPLEGIYMAKNQYAIQGKTWLVDRRAYFYYIAKFMRPINDVVFCSMTTPFTPGCALIIVSKNQPKLVDQALSYSKQLDIVRIRGMDDYLLLTDNVVGVKHILDGFTIQELSNLYRYIMYIVVDYTEPNVEYYVEVNEKNYAEIIPRVATLVKRIAESSARVSPKKTTIDAIKKLKRALKIRG